jgi:hypothetical protein
MTALAAVLIAALVPQDEPRLKEAWPKLSEAWKAIEAYKPDPEAGALDDGYLKVVAKLHGAFEAAGLFGPEGEYLPQAVKAFVRAKARTLSNDGMQGQFFGGLRVALVMPGMPGGGAEPEQAGDPMTTLLASLKKLQELKKEKLDDDDNLADELATARKALKNLGITADETPTALRRRALTLIKALALGEAYPEPAAATPDQAKQVREWISLLGNDVIETREKATDDLRRAGESALPLLRESLKSADAEVGARVRKLLGVGHEPWKAMAAARPQGEGVIQIIEEAPVPAPKDEKK